MVMAHSCFQVFFSSCSSLDDLPLRQISTGLSAAAPMGQHTKIDSFAVDNASDFIRHRSLPGR